VLVSTNVRLLEVANQTGLRLQSVCGGKGLCATCHVYVDSGATALSPVTPREQMSLQMLANRGPTSRLACQAKVLADGVVFSVPAGRYAVSATDAVDYAKLVGRRAEEHVMHPIDGRILVEAGKIITRTRVDALTAASADLEQLRTRTISHDRRSNR
jgi:ferredoxin